MSRTDRDPNRGNRRIPLSYTSVADELGLNDEPAEMARDIAVAVDAARRQYGSLRSKQIAHLAQLLADTRGDGIEGEWAHRLWERGVRVNRFCFAEED